jgi:hypothetical protein
LWRDQLRLALSPDRVVAVRLARGLRPKVAAKEILPCSEGTPSWKGALDTLSQGLLAREPWQRADATVVLSNHFLRYQLLPWSEEIGSEEELAAYARHSFGQVHGEVVREWAVRVDEPRRGQPTLACAVDQGLLDALDASFAAAKARLVSVRPALAAAFNALRPAFPASAAWFVMAERGKLLLALARDDGWQLVAARKAPAESWAAELPLLLDRERRMTAMADAPDRVYVYAADGRRVGLPAGGPWRFEWLRPRLGFGMSADADAAYALALE